VGLLPVPVIPWQVGQLREPFNNCSRSREMIDQIFGDTITNFNVVEKEVDFKPVSFVKE
jgi:hypothetical protein